MANPPPRSPRRFPARDPHPVEQDLGVTAPILIAEDRRLALDGHARGVEGDDHHRLPTMWIRIGVGDPHDDRELASGRGCARAEPLTTG